VKPRNLVIIGIVALAWMLLMRAPADLLYAWFAPKAATVRAIGLEGTLAEGRAAGLMLNGRPLPGAPHWHFEPWWLPLLRCAFAVDSAAGGVNFSGRVSWSPSGLAMNKLHVDGPIKRALVASGLPFAPIDGFARIDLHSLVLRQGFPAAAEGSVEARSVAWSLGKDPLPLGDFKANLSTDGDGILANVVPIAGPLDVNGSLRLRPDHSYEYDLLLKGRPGADPALLNLLQSLGRPDAQGYYRLRNRGSLAPAGALR
jgi:hypothetical protein